jgi:hypothetical protein
VRLDTIEIHGFSDRLTQRIFCTGGRHRFKGVMESLSALTPGGATDYLAITREFIGDYQQRGLLVVISDFLDDNGCERAIQYLSDFGHELLLIQLWAEEDRVPPWDGELELRDAETGAALKLDFDEAARERYTRAFDDYCAGIQTLALRGGGRYAGISAAQPLEDIIFDELIRVQGIA